MRSRSLMILWLFPLCFVSLACPSGDRSGGTLREEVVEFNILGTAYLGQFNWNPANEAFSRALELRPLDPILLNNMGITRVQQNELEEAGALFVRALEQDAGFPWAHYNLGLLAKNDGDFEGAVGHFETVAAHDAKDLHTQYNLASVLARSERPEEAERSFRNALAMNPTHVSTLYALGQFLMQNGRQEEGIELIQRSEEIRTRHGGDTIGTQYGEQGLYAIGVDYPGDALAAPEAIEVGFEPGDSLRLTANAAWTLTAEAGQAALLGVTAEGLSRLNGQTETIGTPETIVALAAADLDNDGRLDLVALRAVGASIVPFYRNADGQWVDDAFSGTADLNGSTASITAVDKDHDGDLDLFWCSEGGCALGINRGDGTFEVDATDRSGFSTGALVAPIQVGFSDIDNDRDIDLLVADASAVRIFSNQRDGTFVASAGADHGGTLEIVDLNKDGAMDLLLGGAGGLRLLANHGGTFESGTLLVDEPVSGVIVTEIDNDGFLDIIFAHANGVSVLHNRGRGEWVRRDDLLAPAGAGTVPIASWDAEGDGDLDLALRTPDGEVVLWTRDGGAGRRSITVLATGVGDNRFGIGSKVEVLAGALRQKFEWTRPVPLLAGLGDRTEVQSVRILWPGGVLQDEVGLDASEVAAVTQLDRKGTSCPLLYAWRDGGWRFVTDFLGGAAIGYQQAPGKFSSPDTDEYVRIDGGLTASDGRLRLRLNNQLEEVLWFDSVELIAVDHPAGTEVYPNERLMPAPPFPEFELFVSGEIRAVAAARGVESGEDLTARLLERDRRTVDDFQLQPYKGYAETHTLELDLGPFDPRERIVLLLDGWIDYADSSANVAALQADAHLIPPRLSVADGSGGWTEAVGRMGFPAGLPKTMSVELSGLFDSTDHRLQIETNMRIYWDRARVLLGGTELPLSVQRIAVERASLRAGGFPRPFSPDGLKPQVYDPEDVARHGGWKAHVGEYTGFGDVTPLLRTIDDAFVTTHNGDEIELEFAAPAPPAPGFVRTYLLFADGFGKDMDPNSAVSSRVGPLPFHGMSHYPYGGELTPPVRPQFSAPLPRQVRESSDGLPGVFPQVLAAAEAGRSER